MSHLRQRKEKNCLNCNAEIYGRYCHICGQENLEVKESLWHLIKHFFNDLTHFDGKFFSTLKYMITKPGFVSSEYMRGRRGSYLNPIRMYIFTSAAFFLVFFSIFKMDRDGVYVNYKVNGKEVDEINAMDSTTFAKFTAELNKGIPMDRNSFQKLADSTRRRSGFHLTGTEYKTQQQYDSVLQSGKKKHNWLHRMLIRREIALNEKYNNNQSRITSALMDYLIHSFPQMLFISLPLFALILKLLYVRRKSFYYTDHIIFSIHLYIYVFLVFLVIIGLTQIMKNTGLEGIRWIIGLLYISLFYYEYRSMRNFYGQGRWKTLLKFFLLTNGHLIIMILLLTFYMFFSFLQI